MPARLNSANRCFNPLPTNKAGRILITTKHAHGKTGFNPLPTNKAGRMMWIKNTLEQQQCFNPLPTNKAGRISPTPSVPSTNMFQSTPD